MVATIATSTKNNLLGDGFTSLFSKGCLDAKLTEKISKVVKAVRKTNKTGSITLQLKITMLDNEHEDPVKNEVCEKYLGLTPQTANYRASTHQLPFNTFRVGKTNKAPRMVHIEDLAHYIEEQQKHAQNEWDRMNC